MQDMPASDPASAPSRLAWSGFADTVWQKGNEPGEPNTFSLGQFTLYPTPTLADNLSMLAEVVVEAEFRHHDVTGTSGFNPFPAHVSFTFLSLRQWHVAHCSRSCWRPPSGCSSLSRVPHRSQHEPS